MGKERQGRARGGSERRLAAPVIDRTIIASHFSAELVKLQGGFGSGTGLAPITKGNAAESSVLAFVRSHLPGSLTARSGHVLYNNTPSKQQDVIVAHTSGLVLPIGEAGLFLPGDVVACAEVKSELSKETLKDASEKFASLQETGPLKVIIAGRLQGDHRHRSRIAKWIHDLALAVGALPDLIFVPPVGAVVRGGTLRVLGALANAPRTGAFYKYGGYQNERWAGLALLVYELSARGTGVDLTAFWRSVLPNTVEVADPDADHA